jgi:hypothetical protein
MIKRIPYFIFILLSFLSATLCAQSIASHETYRTVENVGANKYKVLIRLQAHPFAMVSIREFLPEGCSITNVHAPGAIVDQIKNELNLIWLETTTKPRLIHYQVTTSATQKFEATGDITTQENKRLRQEIIKTEPTLRSEDISLTQTYSFQGKLTNLLKKELEDAQVRNLNGPYQTTTNSKGEFTLSACIGDTLQITRNGYHSFNFVTVANEVLELNMISLDDQQAIRVECKLNANGDYRLYRNGIEYYVKGGGGSEQWEELANIGGNSVRTWSTDNAKEVLDKAHSLGLTVMMGLWMQHERHGFDYDDKPKVQAQLEYFKKIVMEIKDHPALLLWGIGNEVDLFYTNTNVWKAVNDIAKMIHEVDPNHPTSTVTAGLDPAEVKLIMQDAPEIDIYCINTYGDIGSVKKNLTSYGWTGPYMITEWGPNGHWEVTKTRWGAPIEQSSAEKAVSYKERYENEILSASKNCVGSYVFLWGFKQETTSTWYGLFTREGLRSEPIDELELFWSNSELKNKAPHLSSLLLDEKRASESIMLTAERTYKVKALIKDPDNDDLQACWQIVPESTDIKAGGDAESAPMPLSGLFKKKKFDVAAFRAPKTEGAYRLFYEVTDGNGKCAYGNVPFYVVPPKTGEKSARFVKFKQLEMQ